MPPAEPTATSASATEFPHRYDARLAGEIETRWQRRWLEAGAFRTPNPGEPGFDPAKPKFYCLDMFPYPSGAGLHVGHPEGYTATDILCRFKRMKGFTVLHPMGWDAFGLPAEQYAIATGVHPAETTRKAIDNFRRQLRRFGFSYDWSREFATIDPAYYRWTQWIWLQAYRSWFDPVANAARPIAELEAALTQEDREIETAAGARRWSACTLGERQAHLDRFRLAYLGEQTVNWCPKLGTVLANEEVIDGRSERGGHPVLRMPLRQWMFRITAFADRLLSDLDLVQWPESTRSMQREWIGRSEGAEIRFPRCDAEGTPIAGELEVYTTRPDTIFGATYMVVAPEHPLVGEALAAGAPGSDGAALGAYVEAARHRADVDRQAERREKTGVFTGAWALNPATGRAIPVWAADYVLMGYGTGAIMAVPAHDERDFEFARAFGLPVEPVVEVSGSRFDGTAALPDPGVACNSRNEEVSLDGLPTADAKRRVVEWLESRGLGRGSVRYRLRDWLFSRQRYWGEPFPIVYDAEGNHHPVAEAALPVTLPDLADYTPIESDTPQPPLAKATEWVRTTAGAAGVDPTLLPPDAPVRRETNTMPGWAGSCWYYLRFCSPHDDARFVSREAERHWMLSRKDGGAPPERFDPATCHAGGVDLYVGGAEHAVLHLLYARFWHKMLFDLGHVSTPEPIGRLFHQGMITSFAYQRRDRSLVPIDEVDEPAPGTFVERASGEPVQQIVAKMSKSLRNVVTPDEIIEQFGADAFRLYEMYLGPLEASKPWNTRDISGVYRFLQRAWRLAIDERSGALLLAERPDPALERLLHRTIAKVEGDLDRLAFNTAIAAMIELVNAATRPTGLARPEEGGLDRGQLERFVRILFPFAPHVAEELWSRLGHAGSVGEEAWPAFDPALLADDEIEMPVQVGGKVRARIRVPADADAAAIEALALADPQVVPHLGGAAPRKVIVVPGRMVNVVV